MGRGECRLDLELSTCTRATRRVSRSSNRTDEDECVHRVRCVTYVLDYGDDVASHKQRWRC